MKIKLDSKMAPGRARKWAPYGPCGTCQAKAGAPCVNLTVLKGGRHPARVLAAPHKGRGRAK